MEKPFQRVAGVNPNEIASQFLYTNTFNPSKEFKAKETCVFQEHIFSSLISCEKKNYISAYIYILIYFPAFYVTNYL